MGTKKKELCKWKKKARKEKEEKFLQITTVANYSCKKCNRMASGRKWLCKPQKKI